MRKCGTFYFKAKDCLILLFLFALTFVLASCGKPLEISKSQSLIYPDLVVSMSRAPCLGDRPVYDITVRGNGSVSYTGWKHVEVLETRETKITQDKIKELVKEFEAINFLTIESPQLTIRDCPITVISFTLEGKSNKYYDYYVCGFETFPHDEEILHIGKSIDEMTNSKQWLGKEAFEILESLRNKRHPTQRAPDGWESPRFQAVCAA